MVAKQSMPLTCIRILAPFYLLLLAMLLPWKLLAQTTGSNLLEDQYMLSEQNLSNADDQAEMLTRSSLLDLNRANQEQLLNLHILTIDQAAAIMRHRLLSGPLLSIYELNSIVELDVDTRRRLANVCQVVPPQQTFGGLLNASREGRHELTLRLKGGDAAAKGYLPNGENLAPYQGAALQRQVRYRLVVPGKLKVGLNAELDAGEAYTWQPGNYQYGPDFLSGYIQAERVAGFDKVLVGSYQLQLGQGLVQGGAFGLGKSAEAIAGPRRAHLGLRPSNSFIEGLAHQGVAVQRRMGKVEATAFASYKHLDASLFSNPETDDPAFTTWQLTGLHRTPTELAKRGQLTEQMGGLNLHRPIAQLGHAGLVALGTQYSAALAGGLAAYNQFLPEGNQLLHLSAYHSLDLGPFSIFGEIATANGRWAAVQGIQKMLRPTLEACLVARYYGSGYLAHYANAFADATTARNEQGIYLGLRQRLSPNVTATGYVDIYNRPWLSYGVASPARGNEVLLSLRYQRGKEQTITLQLRTEERTRNLSISEDIYQPLPATAQARKTQAALVADVPLSSWLRSRTQVRGTRFAQPGRATTLGMALTQDIWLKTRRFEIGGRVALFDTDDYDTRQYMFERNVLYAYSIPALQGRGSRLMAMLRTQLAPKLDLWLRYSQTRYSDRTEVGSGLDAKPENVDGERTMQLRLDLY